MSANESLEELRRRLDELQRRLADKETEMRRDDRVPAEHRAQIGTIRQQARAVETKLPQQEGTAWEAVRHEVRRDLDALADNFQHTVAYIDSHYRAS